MVLFFLALASGQAFPENSGKKTEGKQILNPDDEPFYNVSLGISPFDGVLGVERQKGSHSIGIGFPERISYRYSVNPYSDTLFYGLYAGRFEEPGDGGKQYRGVKYRDAEGVDAGFGAGYRWQWPSHWNVTATISIHFMEKEYSNPGEPKEKERSVFLFPGINIGYKF